MGFLSKLKRAADFVPGVSNVKGAIEGDWKQAVGGAGWEGLKAGYDAMMPGAVSTAPLDADAARSRALYEDYLRQSKEGSHFSAPDVQAAQVDRPQDVQAPDLQPIQQVTAAQAEGGGDVQFNAPTERV